MKIVIAPDSYKESLTAQQVADTIKAGFLKHYPMAEYVTLPVADGGEGTLDALIAAHSGEMHNMHVEGPLGQPVNARWGLITNESQQTAIIELAEASGIAINSPAERNIELASTYGTGQLIKAALEQGVSRVILCLGGSATNDGGAGIAQALGIKLLDEFGNELPKGGKCLADLATIDSQHLHPRAKAVEWLVACDVSNPLCGKNGASAVFGPQKGATPAQVATLDAALMRFSQVVEATTGTDYQSTPGFGAAGGTPLGMSLCGQLTLKPGIDIVLDSVQLDKHVQNANLVITGEGQMDFQTLYGKAPFGVARLAKKYHVPAIGIAGSLGEDLSGLDEHFSAVFGTVRAPQGLEQVLSEAGKNLETTASNVAAVIKLSVN